MNEAGAFKTHEQAWFLLQCRWMLYLEQGDTLKLLAGVPRAWLEDDRVIAVDGMKSYFGALALRVESHVAAGEITARIACPGDRRPRRVELRLPHPREQAPRSVSGGAWDAACEAVVIDDFTGVADVTARY